MRKKIQFKHFDELRVRKSLTHYVERETEEETFFIMVDGPIIYEARLSKQRSMHADMVATATNEEISSSVKLKK